MDATSTVSSFSSSFSSSSLAASSHESQRVTGKRDFSQRCSPPSQSDSPPVDSASPISQHHPQLRLGLPVRAVNVQSRLSSLVHELQQCATSTPDWESNFVVRGLLPQNRQPSHLLSTLATLLAVLARESDDSGPLDHLEVLRLRHTVFSSIASLPELVDSAFRCQLLRVCGALNRYLDKSLSGFALATEDLDLPIESMPSFSDSALSALCKRFGMSIYVDLEHGGHFKYTADSLGGSGSSMSASLSHGNAVYVACSHDSTGPSVSYWPFAAVKRRSLSTPASGSGGHDGRFVPNGRLSADHGFHSAASYSHQSPPNCMWRSTLPPFGPLFHSGAASPTPDEPLPFFPSTATAAAGLPPLLLAPPPIRLRLGAGETFSFFSFTNAEVSKPACSPPASASLLSAALQSPLTTAFPPALAVGQPLTMSHPNALGVASPRPIPVVATPRGDYSHCVLVVDLKDVLQPIDGIDFEVVAQCIINLTIPTDFLLSTAWETAANEFDHKMRTVGYVEDADRVHLYKPTDREFENEGAYYSRMPPLLLSLLSLVPIQAYKHGRCAAWLRLADIKRRAKKDEYRIKLTELSKGYAMKINSSMEDKGKKNVACWANFSVSELAAAKRVFDGNLPLVSIDDCLLVLKTYCREDATFKAMCDRFLTRSSVARAIATLRGTRT